MRRTRIYLQMTALAAIVLAAAHAAHAAAPHAARAQLYYDKLWEQSELGETCSGSCIKGKKCCRVVAPAPPP
jgi:hypothetical protein